MSLYLKEAVGEFKKVRTITGAGVTVAVTTIVDTFRIVVSQLIEISFSFLGLVLAGMLYGPVVAGAVGFAADMLEYLIRPTGSFFFGFTLNKILTGVIYGLFFYKQKMTIERIITAEVVNTIIISLILTPIWLNIMYGSELFAVARIVKAVVMLPINVFLIKAISKAISLPVFNNRKSA